MGGGRPTAPWIRYGNAQVWGQHENHSILHVRAKYVTVCGYVTYVYVQCTPLLNKLKLILPYGKLPVSLLAYLPYTDGMSLL